ncbi:MAG: DegT/DnrJ/EryC1/StrS family aminotransferase [Deltaproteobacteria bacterium]|nr:DegT/DnrJ/EryC1/StrS family aminotransferase [Deltaproteobacteria bacterium]
MKVPILKIPFDQGDAEQITEELKEMLLEGRLAMGVKTQAFQEAFSAFCGTDYALSCTNGTAALEIILRAIGVEGGSVAVPANTFLATALAAIAAGAKIVLVDNDSDHFQMCPQDLRKKIRPDTKAVILVHIGGFISPKWREIQRIAAENGAALVEDAAHAHGAEVEGGIRAGNIGMAAGFSFFPTKVLTTAEGGMVTTSDQSLFNKMLALRQHGQQKPGSNIHETFGLNYRPSEIHALLGLRMMAKAEWILFERRKIAFIYDELLRDSKVKPVSAPAGHKPAYYKYMALLPQGVDRAEVKSRLREKYRIALPGEVYAVAGHLQPLWANHPEYLASKIAPLPNAEMVSARQVCLPIWPSLSEDDQNYVVNSLLEVIEEI